MFTYDEARKYIHSAEKNREKPGLLRISALLNELGNPQNAQQYVHIAGTNGKGSTTAMIASVLQTAGYKTGLYVSPFVEEFEERISVDGKNISKHDLARLVYQVSLAGAQCVARGIPSPSEFEIITATAFLYYKEQKCELVALETGLGGRFDATNVILPPLVSVITSISLDHMKTLGGNVVDIFKEKWGIAKKGSAVVLYPRQDPLVFSTAKASAAEQEMDLIVPDLTRLEIQYESLEGTVFKYERQSYHTPLIGAHQVYNAITAIEAIQALRMCGYNLHDRDIIEGIQNTVFMGRFEIIKKEPLVILDGAHNENGIKMLQKAALHHLKTRSGKLITIMGMLADKNFSESIPKIASISDVFIACTVDNYRTLLACDALLYASACPTLYQKNSVKEAVEMALHLAEAQDTILICGSLYLIGDARKVVLGRELTPFSY